MELHLKLELDLKHWFELDFRLCPGRTYHVENWLKFLYSLYNNIFKCCNLFSSKVATYTEEVLKKLKANLIGIAIILPSKMESCNNEVVEELKVLIKKFVRLESDQAITKNVNNSLSSRLVGITPGWNGFSINGVATLLKTT